ncbi:MAG: OmpH family outer membrane protein [Bryobacteraceae bacterium]
MKKNIAVFHALLLGFAALASSQAPSAIPTKIGIIHMEEALATTKEGQKAGAELQAKYQPKKDALDKKQASIQAMQAQQAKGRATMSADALQKLQDEIEAAIKSYNRDHEDAQAEMDEQNGKVLNELGGKMMEILKAYALLNNFAVILDVSSEQTPVLWEASSVDITSELIRLYDEKYPVAGAAAPAAAKPAVPAGASTVKPPTPAAPPPRKQ